MTVNSCIAHGESNDCYYYGYYKRLAVASL